MSWVVCSPPGRKRYGGLGRVSVTNDDLYSSAMKSELQQLASPAPLSRLAGSTERHNSHQHLYDHVVGIALLKPFWNANDVTFLCREQILMR